MRIISGNLKGREIVGYQIEGTRPTMARVKESIFGSIQNYIVDSVVLDLFAGSGNLGIEAISNGAKECYFVDNNKEVIRVLKNNVGNLNIEDQVVILFNDYKKALRFFYEKGLKFGIIFVDPPYKYEIMEEVIDLVLRYDLLARQGVLVLEYQFDKFALEQEGLCLFKDKKYGDKFVRIYKKC